MSGILKHFAKRIRSTYEPGKDDPWWYDNLGHMASGFIIAVLGVSAGLDDPTTVLLFLAVAVVWEWFEYAYNIRPWDEREDWTFDRAMEDTLLDTLMGLLGVWFALGIL